MTKSEVATQQFRYGPMPRPERPCINFGEAGRVGGDAVIRFRRFCLLPRARQLLADGQPIELGSRAFDLLVVLLKGRGNLVTKDEIVRHVWPSTMVDECNLRAQMATLRKVLGKDRDVVKTVPGLGYVFSVEAAAGAAGQSVATPPGAEPASPAGLPAPGSLRRPWPMAAPPEFPREHTQPTVVVIDDDRDVREALHGLLRSAGLRAELFASVQEFLGSARTTAPGCLVLDVWLPGKNGLDFYADFVTANARLPVIFISGFADVAMSVRAMKAGAVEFLTKPVRDQDLLNAIRLAIASPPFPRA